MRDYISKQKQTTKLQTKREKERGREKEDTQSFQIVTYHNLPKLCHMENPSRHLSCVSVTLQKTGKEQSGFTLQVGEMKHKAINRLLKVT